MNDWLIWNGVRTSDMGVAVLSLPPVTIPEERAAFEEVRGRSGTVAMLEGEQIYKDMVLSAECLLREPSRLEEVIAWLQGGGEVEFANRPEGHYRARIVNQIELSRVIAASAQRRFTVNFRCQPGWIHDDVPTLTITQSGKRIDNPGTLASLPRIAIEMSKQFVSLNNTARNSALRKVKPYGAESNCFWSKKNRVSPLPARKTLTLSHQRI